MTVIAQQLHANAIRIEGEDVDRLVAASQAAHCAGLAVYFNPWKMNAGIEETRAYVVEAASAAERLRLAGVDIVFVASCEYSIFCSGIYPGDTLNERLAWMGQYVLTQDKNNTGEHTKQVADTAAALNAALKSFVDAIRANFVGPVTYSAGAWEDIDWSIFDIVGVDYYRNGESDAAYRDGLRKLPRGGKPLAIMEFGCCAYQGAAALGGGGFMVLRGINEDGSGIFADDQVPVRSEGEQANYVAAQLDVFDTEDVDAAFVYVFSFPLYRIGEGARDLDMVSYSLVKTFASSDPRSQLMPPWEPKLAFSRVAEIFSRKSTSQP